MRILHLAPLWFPISADAPGGIETLLAHLLDAFEGLGCKNTVLASGDSKLPGRLIPVLPTGLHGEMKAGLAGEQLYYEQHQLSQALHEIGHFDVVHSHIGPTAYILSALPAFRRRILHTHHWPVYADLEWYTTRHPDLWFSTVSEYQAEKLRRVGAHRCTVVPNGLSVKRFTFSSVSRDLLVFVGRIERAKGPDLAIRAARASGRPLVLAGPIVEPEFFQTAIKPFLNGKVTYRGVIDHVQKNELLGQAACVLMPSRAAEPFGMVSIEAMACGTPVVALAHGALPEIIEPGRTGYVTEDSEQLAALAVTAGNLDRAVIRQRVAERFDIQNVARAYLDLYEQMLRDV